MIIKGKKITKIGSFYFWLLISIAFGVACAWIYLNKAFASMNLYVSLLVGALSLIALILGFAELKLNNFQIEVTDKELIITQKKTTAVIRKKGVKEVKKYGEGIAIIFKEELDPLELPSRIFSKKEWKQFSQIFNEQGEEDV